MPVDISERLSEIISILSFLRVAEEWHQKPSQSAGFFYSDCLVVDHVPVSMEARVGRWPTTQLLGTDRFDSDCAACLNGDPMHTDGLFDSFSTIYWIADRNSQDCG
ncbi:hypothetical protein [Pseudomonas putida]